MEKLLLITFTLLYITMAAQTPFSYHNNLSKQILTVAYMKKPGCGIEDSASRGGRDIKDFEEVLSEIKAHDIGTGFVYQHGNEKYIITCLHVVYDGNNVVGYDTDYNAYELEFISADYFYDLAILKFKQPEDANRFQAVKLDYSYEASNDVWAVGYWKIDGKPSINQGNILHNEKSTDYSLPLELMGYVKSNAHTEGGYSGGVLYNCEGQVVGMNNSATRDGTTSYALESRIINRIARDILNPDRRMVQRAYTGIRFAQNLEGGPVLIDDILPYSPAAMYISRLKGKSVKSINGNAIDNIYDVLNIMEERQPQDRIILELNTDDADREFDIIPELLEKKSLRRIAEHALQHEENVSIRETEVIISLEKDEVVKEKIGTMAGLKGSVVYCLNNIEQLGVIVRAFGLHRSVKISIGDNIKSPGKEIYFSDEGDMRVLYY